MFRQKPILGFRIEIIVEPDDSGFHAYCPALTGLHVGGDTEGEALKNARDAALAYLESLIKHHDPIPVGIITREPASEKLSAASGVKRHTEDLKVACSI